MPVFNLENVSIDLLVEMAKDNNIETRNSPPSKVFDGITSDDLKAWQQDENFTLEYAEYKMNSEELQLKCPKTRNIRPRVFSFCNSRY